MKKLIFIAFMVISLFAASPIDIIIRSSDVVDSLSTISETPIPKKLFKKARAIVIVPDLIKGGFILGARYGEGVLMVRTQNGWSDPVFVKMFGGSIGWQIGVQKIDAIFFFISSHSVKSLLDGKITLGADAAIAAGPLGRHGEADTDIKLDAEIYSYAKSKGLFAGLSFGGAVLKIDRDKTRAFYKGVSLKDILSGNYHKNNPYINVLKHKLQELAL